MKSIKSILFLFLVILVLLVGCESYTGSHTEVTNTNTKESYSVKLTDKEAKDILNRLIPKAEGVHAMFNGSGWFKVDEAKTIPGEKEYCLVIGYNWKMEIDTQNVRAIADLKKVVEEVFTKDCAQEVFYSRYLVPDTGDRPLYKDYEGRLYVDTENGDSCPSKLPVLFFGH